MRVRSRRLGYYLLAAAGLLLALLVAARYLLPFYIIHFIKQRSTEIVRERFHAEVQFGSFDISLFLPQLTIIGENVTIMKRQGNRGVALIFVKKFAVDSSLMEFIRT